MAQQAARAGGPTVFWLVLVRLHDQQLAGRAGVGGGLALARMGFAGEVWKVNQRMGG